MGLQIRKFMEEMDKFSVSAERLRFAKHYLKGAKIPFTESEGKLIVDFSKRQVIVTNEEMIVKWSQPQPQNSK